MLENADILFLGANAWDTIVQRPQHLARGLAERNRVLYVDPGTYSLLTHLRPAARSALGNRPTRPALRRLSGSLRVYTPPPLLPFSLRSPAVQDWNARILERLLARVLRSLRFRPALLWASSPPWWPLVRRFPDVPLCYDCLDSFPAFYPDRRGVLLARQEERLLERARAVLAAEGQLAERCADRNPNVHRVPNAADPAFLDPAPTPCPADLAGLPPPRVGYVGALAHWVDFGLIRFLAEARPAWSFVLVGPGEGGRELAGLRNVHRLGPRPHRALPAYLDRFDACLIPFRDLPLTRTVDPVKLYEYLARGKPVAALRTPALEAFSSVCALASDRRGFLDALDRALEESGGERERRVRDRVALAAANTWPVRTEQVLRILGDLSG